MREILFRGKAINRDKGFHRTSYKNGEWVYGLISRLYDERFKNLPAEMINTDGIGGIEVDYKTISQFTGLTDKNGKKIFEGDILSERPPMNQTAYIGYVAYDEKSAVWRFMIKNDTKYNGVLLGCYSSSYEVIGNIYDNTELLKEGDKK